MLKLQSGSYHPTLERAFTEQVQSLKRDPLTPLVVIASTSRLADRLQILLGQNGRGFLNIHFHTLSSIAQSVVNAETQHDKPLLMDSLFYDTLVKSLIREKRPFRRIEEMAVPNGFPPAVRSTLRDLLEAGVEADNVRQAMEEEFVGRQVDLGSLRELLTLYQHYLSRLEQLPVIPRIELLRRAIDLAPQSKYLAQFSHLLFYGFYDLTGLQADLLLSIVKHHPSSLYLPYIYGDPDFAFSKRFRDNFLQTISFDEAENSDHRLEKPPYKVINVSGLHDEAWTIGQEVLKLHQVEKIPFHEMAVIVRQQDRLSRQIIPLFRMWNIPFSTSATESLVGQPQIVRALELLRTASWPQEKTWAGHVQFCRQFLTEHRGEIDPHSSSVWESIMDGLESLIRFNLIGTVSSDEFLDTLTERWNRMEVSNRREQSLGVSLLHAEAGRGLRFKVVFLAGMEERVFPRVIREDPFLRDDARFALSDTLGYKIPQKLSSLEEERLLFRVLTDSASERLYFLYQRSDDEGKIVGPSPFLRAYIEADGAKLDDCVESVPRTYEQKVRSASPLAVSKREAVTHYLSLNQSNLALDFAKELRLDVIGLERGLNMLTHTSAFDEPGPFDGLVGPVTDRVVFPRGHASPSAMETYGLCPFKYLATRIWELEPFQPEVRKDAIAPQEKGRVVHAFMERFFSLFLASGRSAGSAFPEDIFNRAFEETISITPPAEAPLHPLLWESLRGKMAIDLRAYLARALEEVTEENLTPTFFEQQVTVNLQDLPAPSWFGKIDRIDLGNGRVRVVDYKTGKLPDGTVVSASLTGLRAQGPLYILMVEEFLRRQGLPFENIEFAYHQIGGQRENKAMSAEDWRSARRAIIGTLRDQLELARAGNFLIVPDDNSNSKYCRHCDVNSICRRNDSLSAYRASLGEGQKLMAIRTKKLPGNKLKSLPAKVRL